MHNSITRLVFNIQSLNYHMYKTISHTVIVVSHYRLLCQRSTPSSLIFKLHICTIFVVAETIIAVQTSFSTAASSRSSLGELQVFLGDATPLVRPGSTLGSSHRQLWLVHLWSHSHSLPRWYPYQVLALDTLNVSHCPRMWGQPPCRLTSLLWLFFSHDALILKSKHK